MKHLSVSSCTGVTNF